MVLSVESIRQSISYYRQIKAYNTLSTYEEKQISIKKMRLMEEKLKKIILKFYSLRN